MSVGYAVYVKKIPLKDIILVISKYKLKTQETSISPPIAEPSPNQEEKDFVIKKEVIKNVIENKEQYFYLKYLATKLLLLIEKAEDYSYIMTEFNKLPNDEYIVERIKFLASAINDNTSLLHLLAQLDNLDLEQTVSLSSNNTFIKMMLQDKLLDKLFIIKKIDSKVAQYQLSQLHLAKQYLINNQLNLAIDAASKIENNNIKLWLEKAQKTYDIINCAQEIYHYLN
jgi:hypothetical protein